MSRDPHFGFVIAAYLLAFAVIGGMMAAILIDYMRLKRALSALAASEPHQPGAAEVARPDFDPHPPGREGPN